MTERMMDERWTVLKAARDWSMCQQSEISDELDRARRAESMTFPDLAQQLLEKDAEIARLKVEVSRLTPSGQMAEDMTRLAEAVAYLRWTGLRDAFSRLAMKTHGDTALLGQKDAQIKALADAVEGVLKSHDRDPRYSGLSWDDANALRAALRLAGRL